MYKINSQLNTKPDDAAEGSIYYDNITMDLFIRTKNKWSLLYEPVYESEILRKERKDKLNKLNQNGI